MLLTAMPMPAPTPAVVVGGEEVRGDAAAAAAAAVNPLTVVEEEGGLDPAHAPRHKTEDGPFRLEAAYAERRPVPATALRHGRYETSEHPGPLHPA